MGVSASALSHAIRTLENRLHIRLFHRTTRSISLTEAGRQLYTDLAPCLKPSMPASIISATSATRSEAACASTATYTPSAMYCGKNYNHLYADTPKSASNLPANRAWSILLPNASMPASDWAAISRKIWFPCAFPRRSPCALSPALPICPHTAHGTPQTPADLSAHECHSSRQPTTGAVWTWDLRHPKSGKTLQFHPQARLLADGSSELLKQIALADLGLVCVFDDIVSRELASGALVSVLDDWAISYDGYYLYYPNHHISSPVLNALVAALRE
ncbi:lysR substrate binding domain protein [Neisseria musculi]|uniref:Bacterial regulatory helix-turn-helix lysR family protein n=2 Tax=Neisseria musculi TaxID=1815583 RepID=A0A7H1MAB8_9NEIS|nr:lysR substrate binding domain protein [Neisseria musculi]